MKSRSVVLGAAALVFVLSSRSEADWCVKNETGIGLTAQVWGPSYYEKRDVNPGARVCVGLAASVDNMSLRIDQDLSRFGCLMSLDSNGEATLRAKDRSALGVSVPLLYCEVDNPRHGIAREPWWAHDDIPDLGRQVRFMATADPQYELPDEDGGALASNRLSDRVLSMARGLLGLGDRRGRRGIIIAGDLTQFTAPFEIDNYKNALSTADRYTHDGLGNHDYSDGKFCGADNCDLVLLKLVRDRNRVTAPTGRAPVGNPHYSWDWHDVHFVQLNLMPSNRLTSNPQRTEDPYGALGFLIDDLADHVGQSGRPVVLIHHYGFDAFSTKVSNPASEDDDCGPANTPCWWDAEQRRDYWDAIKDYNVAAILTGHNHKALTDDPKADFKRPTGTTEGPASIPGIVVGAARGALPGDSSGALTDIAIDGDWLFSQRLDDRGIGVDHDRRLIFFGTPGAEIETIDSPKCTDPTNADRCTFRLVGRAILPPQPDFGVTMTPENAVAHRWTTTCTVASSTPTDQASYEFTLSGPQVCYVTYHAVNGFDPRKWTSLSRLIDHLSQKPTVSVPADFTVEANRPSPGPGAIVDDFGVTAFDEQDGDVGVACDRAPGSLFPMGATTVSCSARDSDGNTSDPRSFKITVEDKTPPVVTAQIWPPPNAEGWRASKVSLTWERTDLVGVTGSNGCFTRIFNLDVIETVTCTVWDAAGNTASASVTIKLDKTPPTVAFAEPSSPANEHGWHRSDVFMNYLVSDGGSGLASYTLSGQAAHLSPPYLLDLLVFQSDGKDMTRSIDATDRAGNAVHIVSPKVSIDRVAPTITARTDRAPDVDNWYTADVRVDFTCGDALSGTDSCSAPATIADEGVNRSARGVAVDLAGNAAEVVQAGINLDKTAPTLTGLVNVVVPATSLAGATAAFSVTASDAVSGVPAGVSCSPASGTLFPVGDTTVTCVALDAAGNRVVGVLAVTVLPDRIAPSLTVPAPILVETTTTAGAVVTFNTSATDNLEGPMPVTCAPASGAVFPLGATPVVCSATDAFGNRGTAGFEVRIGLLDVTTPGEMTGNGSVRNDDARYHFGFLVRERPRDGEGGQFTLRVARNDGARSRGGQGHDDVFTARTVGYVAFGGDGQVSQSDAVIFSGEGSWNGAEGYQYEVQAADEGRTGRIRIVVRSPTGAVVASVDGEPDRGQIRSSGR